MNKENLLRMADHIEKVPQERFDMRNYRVVATDQHLCVSIGDIIGHSVELDNWENIPLHSNRSIDFAYWATRFTGIRDWSNYWDYLFSDKWAKTDNTPIGAAKRIRYLVENGLPVDWEEQMRGAAPLSYLEN